MKDYIHYQVDDLVADSYFRQWVKQPTDASDRFWNDFLTEHPERAEVVHQAVTMVQNLSKATADLTAPVDEAQKAAIWKAVKDRIHTPVQATDPPFVIHASPRRWITWAAAASVAVAMSLGGWFWSTHSSNEVQRQPIAARLPANPLIDHRNQTAGPRLISLPDGSSVVLQSGGRIRYRTLFVDSIRQVSLTGEGYFEVAKDAQHPFIVRANELVTKVLGTSFNVRAYADDAQVTVTVRSGRVAVFTTGPNNGNQSRRPAQIVPDSVILTRNQQLVFARQQEPSVRRREVTLPTNIAKGSLLDMATFVYKATPIKEVFRELERVYGITIRYDTNALESCRLTTDLSDEPLLDKMTIICKSVEATYTVKDTHFTVYGHGCR